MGEKPDKNVLKIDLNNLEKDCLEQPRLAYEWGQELARAKRKTSSLSNNLKLTAAQLAVEIRARPEEFGIRNKPSVDEVKENVLVQTAYQECQRELLEAQEEEDTLQAMVYALIDRKAQLENLTKLHGQMYWSKPNTNESKEVDRVEVMQESTSTLNKSKPKKK